MTGWFGIRGDAGRLAGLASRILACLIAAAGSASAQTPPTPSVTLGSGPAGRSDRWTLTVTDMLRVESWRFFEPRSDGGDPDYVFAGNRLLLQARMATPRLELTLAAQHVGLVNLPRDASGPGALGTGALYFAQGNGDADLQQLYLRYATLRLKGVAPGLDLQIGRQAYASGAEAAATDPKIEAVKRQRLDARLVGEFEWSLYQRAFDGLRVQWTGRDLRLTGAAFMPTQGGFAQNAGRTMTGVVVAGGVLDLLPSRARPRTALQAFFWRYMDDRDVTGRPDNTGLAATAADVGITTAGGSVIGAYPARQGQVDVLGWLALQRGGWYGQDHRAVGFAAEAGYQWTRAPWAPWLRTGVLHASGDDDPGDDRHGSFFPMLPTVRRFSQTTAYSTMNLGDFLVQALLRPHAHLNVRVDAHRLWLASARDRWYAGSGATLAGGGNFGYVSRPSNGSTDLGVSLEASVTYARSRHWSANAFAGTITGGPVVTGTFEGRRLWFVYGEAGWRLDVPWR